jgi:hypothetical protein
MFHRLPEWLPAVPALLLDRFLHAEARGLSEERKFFF